MIRTPIFVSGIGRSGTSAVIAALCEHADVRRPRRIGEAPFVKAFLDFLYRYEDASSSRDYNLKNCWLDQNERAAEFSRLMENMQYGLAPDADANDERFWIGKVSLSETLLRKAIAVLGEVRIVYVMRNGIEVVNSARNFAGFSHLDFEQLCHRWVNNLAEAEYLVNEPNCVIVRHDELVANPNEAFEKVYARLGMAKDKRPAEFIATTFFNSSFGDPGQTSTPSADRLSGRMACWEQWSSDERDCFIEVCDTAMTENGFERPYRASEAA